MVLVTSKHPIPEGHRLDARLWVYQEPHDDRIELHLNADFDVKWLSEKIPKDADPLVQTARRENVLTIAVPNVFENRLSTLTGQNDLCDWIEAGATWQCNILLSKVIF